MATWTLWVSGTGTPRRRTSIEIIHAPIVNNYNPSPRLLRLSLWFLMDGTSDIQESRRLTDSLMSSFHSTSARLVVAFLTLTQVACSCGQTLLLKTETFDVNPNWEG